MIVYSFFNGEEFVHFATKRQAINVAREIIRHDRAAEYPVDLEIEIWREVYGRITKERLIALLNGSSGGLRSREIVWRSANQTDA